MKPEIRVVADAEAVAEEAAVILQAHAGEHIALSGGSTPRAAYERAAGKRSDWSDTTLWLGDERMVPPEDERSNFKLVTDTWVAPLLPDARPQLQRVLTEADIETAAADYGRRLRDALGPDGALGLAIMGMGPDGHTASLFPGKPAADVVDPEQEVAGVPEAGMDPFVPRVTLTLPVFDAAAEVVFLVAGADKAEMVARVFGDTPDPALPSARVEPTSGRLVLLCDEAAAAGL
jgi:6-phosphogluconolactonase